MDKEEAAQHTESTEVTELVPSVTDPRLRWENLPRGKGGEGYAPPSGRSGTCLAGRRWLPAYEDQGKQKEQAADKLDLDTDYVDDDEDFDYVEEENEYLDFVDDSVDMEPV